MAAACTQGSAAIEHSVFTIPPRKRTSTFVSADGVKHCGRIHPLLGLMQKDGETGSRRHPHDIMAMDSQIRFNLHSEGVFYMFRSVQRDERYINCNT